MFTQIIWLIESLVVVVGSLNTPAQVESCAQMKDNSDSTSPGAHVLDNPLTPAVAKLLHTLHQMFTHP